MICPWMSHGFRRRNIHLVFVLFSFQLVHFCSLVLCQGTVLKSEKCTPAQGEGNRSIINFFYFAWPHFISVYGFAS